MGILELQCTVNLFGLLKTCVNVDLFSLVSSVSKNLINQTSFLYTRVPKFPLDISARLLLENFIEQNKLRPILIKKYGGLEKNIEMLVFHQILLMKLSTNLKKKQKKLLYLNGYLKKEKYLL